MTSEIEENASHSDEQNSAATSQPPKTDYSDAVPRDVFERTIKTIKAQHNDKLKEYEAKLTQFAQQNPESKLASISSDELRKIAQEEADRLFNTKLEEQKKSVEEQQAKEWGESFERKIDASQQANPKVKQHFTELNLLYQPNLLGALSMLEPSDLGAVIQDLYNRPEAYSNMLVLAQNAPARAGAEITKLAEGLRAQNVTKETKQQFSSPSPLSQIKSNTTTDNNAGTSGFDWNANTRHW